MISDKDFLEKIQCFDEEALVEVYDRYSPGIYRYAARLLADQDLAEECVSETFSRFLLSLKDGQGPQDYLQAYLFRIAHNWITDLYRRKTPQILPLDPEWRADSHVEPELSVAESMERQDVRVALLQLTPDQRMVISLKFYEGWSNHEIAYVLEKPVSAVKALQHRGLNALRRLLDRKEEVVYDNSR